MNTQPRYHLIFDFFGVFCPDISREWFTKTVPDYQTKLPAFYAICKESDRGRLSKAGFITAISDLTGITDQEIITGINREIIVNSSLVTYVQNLKKRGHSIAILSNGTHEWTTQVMDDIHVTNLFDTVIVSSEVHTIKPEPEIFALTLQKLGVQPSQAIFIDDRKANVEAAKKYGIKSFLFTDTQKLIDQFKEIGI